MTGLVMYIKSLITTQLMWIASKTKLATSEIAMLNVVEVHTVPEIFIITRSELPQDLLLLHLPPMGTSAINDMPKVC